MEIPAMPLAAASAAAESSSTAVTRVPNDQIDQVFARTTNLASSALNATVLSRSNDYFAAAENLLTPGPPVHKPGVFVHTGAWYDGWETRRHNPEAYDWVVIKLGVSSGAIEGVEVDTAHFVGNYGEKAELQGFYAPAAATAGGDVTDEQIASPEFNGWKSILPVVECGPSQRRAWKINSYNPANPTPYTHVRLLMYPDGGFARLRLYGHAIPPPAAAAAVAGAQIGEAEEELSSALLGGLALSASDQHYTPASNTLLPGRGKDMGDGWETARSRTPGHVDWAIYRLGLSGTVRKIVVDTKDFRGNYPREIRVHGLVKTDDGNATDPSHDHAGWVELLNSDKKTQADTEHVFEGAELAAGADDKRVFTHVKLTLIPDGGVKRFRVFGQRAL